MALLELRGVAKHFGAIEALKGVDLYLAPRLPSSAPDHAMAGKRHGLA